MALSLSIDFIRILVNLVFIGKYNTCWTLMMNLFNINEDGFDSTNFINNLFI